MHAIVPHHVEQHAEAAAALWTLRHAATDQPHCAIRHLVRVEERLGAHLGAVRAGGGDGLAAACERLAQRGGPGELFVAALLALEAGDRALLDELVELARLQPETQAGLLGALGWIAPRRLAPFLRPWLAGDGFSRCLGLAACSAHRSDAGAALERLVEDPEPAVRGRALRLAGELGRADLCAAAAAAADESHGPAALWGAWAAALLGDPAAGLPVLEQAAENEPDGGPALDAAVRAARRETARAWIRGLGEDPRRGRLMVRALGILGDPAGVPWLLGRMADPELARAAGESFALLTGVDLAHDDLAADTPPDLALGPEAGLAADGLPADPDAGLPWPDPDLVRDWWERRGGMLARGSRYILGRPVDTDGCKAAWSQGFQRQRRAAAYELALMRPDVKLRNWRARLLPRGNS
ncbi:TIGR02270 family protein [Marinimicrococcus flavescens]|uniref:TIGR02270 family protein n=1 Tax=Marinimicrococcus flavescens TaxID=3031815 RepID=A0AAP4D642_9PROT|nr:TIGR02270 family protein [Marinimicrococcus flavescens]